MNEEKEEENKEKKEMKVITLCGSSSFKYEFERIEAELTLKGNVVLSPRIYEASESDTLSRIPIKIPFSKILRELLEKIHLAKIDMSDAIFVINVNNYIGDSTRREIEYAKSTGKSVMYLNTMSTSGEGVFTLSQDVELW